MIKLEKGSPDIEPLRFVAQATAVKDIRRYYLNWVHVEPERIVATDGHRLHIARVEVPVNGDTWYPHDSGDARHYTMEKNNKTAVTMAPVDNESGANYPDIDRVIPDTTGRTMIELGTCKAKDWQKISCGYTALIRAMSDYTVNFDYYAQVATHCGYAWLSGAGESILFTDTAVVSEAKYTAVIMPMRT